MTVTQSGSRYENPYQISSRLPLHFTTANQIHMQPQTLAWSYLKVKLPCATNTVSLLLESGFDAQYLSETSQMLVCQCFIHHMKGLVSVPAEPVYRMACLPVRSSSADTTLYISLPDLLATVLQNVNLLQYDLASVCDLVSRRLLQQYRVIDSVDDEATHDAVLLMTELKFDLPPLLCVNIRRLKQVAEAVYGVLLVAACQQGGAARRPFVSITRLSEDPGLGVVARTTLGSLKRACGLSTVPLPKRMLVLCGSRDVFIDLAIMYRAVVPDVHATRVQMQQAREIGFLTWARMHCPEIRMKLRDAPTLSDGAHPCLHIEDMHCFLRYTEGRTEAWRKYLPRFQRYLQYCEGLAGVYARLCVTSQAAFEASKSLMSLSLSSSSAAQGGRTAAKRTAPPLLAPAPQKRPRA